MEGVAGVAGVAGAVGATGGVEVEGTGAGVVAEGTGAGVVAEGVGVVGVGVGTAFCSHCATSTRFGFAVVSSTASPGVNSSPLAWSFQLLKVYPSRVIASAAVFVTEGCVTSPVLRSTSKLPSTLGGVVEPPFAS